MSTDVLRLRATETFTHRPKRLTVFRIVITLATIAGVLSIPTHGASAPVFTQNGWSTSVEPDVASVRVGDRIVLRVTVSASTARTGLVDVEITNAAGGKVFQRFWDNRSFAANTPRTSRGVLARPDERSTGRAHGARRDLQCRLGGASPLEPRRRRGHRRPQHPR